MQHLVGTDGFCKQFAALLAARRAGRLFVDLGGELNLAATLEYAEPASEVELDLVRTREVRGDVRLAKRVVAARALPALNFSGKHPQD